MRVPTYVPIDLDDLVLIESRAAKKGQSAKDYLKQMVVQHAAILRMEEEENEDPS